MMNRPIMEMLEVPMQVAHGPGTTFGGKDVWSKRKMTSILLPLQVTATLQLS